MKKTKQNKTNKKQKKNNNNKKKKKIFKKNETINLTKLLYETTILNLQKIYIKSLCDKKKIYGSI